MAGSKISTQKSLAFLYTNNEISEREIKESIPFTIATKRIKYLGINLPKETNDAVKVLHSICQQMWKTQQWPQDWKRSVSFQSQSKAMPTNVQTTAQLHSSHTLVK